MEYVREISFWIQTAILTVSIVMLVSSVRIRGKKLLLSFCVLLIFLHTGFYILNMLLRNDTLNYEHSEIYINSFVICSTVFHLFAWTLFLFFIIRLKSVKMSHTTQTETCPVVVSEDNTNFMIAAENNTLNPLETSGLRGSGKASIFWGIVAIILGLATAAASPVNVILSLIGLCLLIEGIWLVCSPCPAGFIVDGILLMVLGVWNMLIGIDSESVFFPVLGIFQIIAGIKSIIKYNKMPSHNISPIATEINS